MSREKIAITIEKELVQKLDHMVKKKIFSNRSEAIQKAVEEKILKYDRIRLAKECAKLDPKFEQKMAEDGISLEIQEWPEY